MFKNVSFSYPGQSKAALTNLSLSIEPKQKIAIVGLNGAGKTTLLKLMLGLLAPDEGEVKFRGMDVREWDSAAFRKKIGVVFQDFSRFRLTLFENIALASTFPPYTDIEDAVLGAAKATGVDEIAGAAPLGYETFLGREFVDGIELSGGQWQKVALARGMLRNAEVLLLDEPSAALDAESERAMFEHILSLSQDKTTVIVSHRLSLTPLVDQVFVLDNGALIEQGTHNELMELNQKYARLYKTQAGMYWPNAV
jgi:ATP-binding cassette subfamily B protein